ncbi:RNA polymerase sigma factor [uncultured Ruthenibacterium sp.]|uniref:RNA polymerase sigma factor n=1 Tax=uncultured Ruthenibacterium sp. TaxID=1905347 RepID=UPI00349EFDB9
MTVREYEAMVLQYEKLVYTVCYQFVQNSHTAEDLAQETFLSAWTHRDDCRPDAQKAWLCRIAANKAKDYLKSAYHRHAQATDDEMLCQFFDTNPSPAHTAEIREMANSALENICEMDDIYRDVCLFYFVNGCSVSEIAHRLNRPLRTVHTQIYRARTRLRQQLATA